MPGLPVIRRAALAVITGSVCMTTLLAGYSSGSASHQSGKVAVTWGTVGSDSLIAAEQGIVTAFEVDGGWLAR